MDPLEKYIQSIKGFSRITRQREKELSRIIRRSRNEKNIEKAEEEMVHGNLFLVVDRAFRHKKKFGFLPINIMDLIAEGNIGLMTAAKNYRSDHKSKANFCTYAIPVIDAKIIRFIRMDRFIHLPEHYLRYKTNFKKLKEMHGGKLTDEVVMREIGISREMMEVLKDDINQSAVYLEDVFSAQDGEETYWNDILEDTKSVTPSEKTSNESLSEYLKKYLKRLNKREQMVVRERHLSDSQLSYDDIALSMGISRERVRQIYLAALRKLKRFIAIDWQAKHGDPRDNPDDRPIYTLNDYSKSLEERAEKRIRQCDKAFKHLLTGES